MINRRYFFQSIIAAGIGSSIHLNERSSFTKIGALKRDETLITILHTNDLHSRIDPLPAGDPYADKGGFARLATLVKRMRAQNPNTLVVDAGDVFQGTPYFNLFKGEAEYKGMSAIGYDVGTLGNHEFDNGVDALASAMRFATFDFVSANYEVTGTSIEPRVRPFIIRTLDQIRLGIFGLGINLAGLNTPNTTRGVRFLDPIETAQKMVRVLRTEEHCDLVICLSHLGYYPHPRHGEIGDTQVAALVDGIDFIASGHTHTFMSEPIRVHSPSGHETVIFQVGMSGAYLGRIDFTVKKGQRAAITGRALDTAVSNREAVG